MSNCFHCLNCGKQNTKKGDSYTNKYCNNSCQQQHRSRLLVSEWQESAIPPTWKQAPEWVKKHLIGVRGHRCERCNGTTHHGRPIPLVIDYRDRDTRNTREENLRLICPNCRAMT